MTYGYIFQCDNDDCEVQTHPSIDFSMNSANEPPNGWFTVAVTNLGQYERLHFCGLACLHSWATFAVSPPRKDSSTLHVDMCGPDLSVPGSNLRRVVDRPQA
jgi:hypothetical protein